MVEADARLPGRVIRPRRRLVVGADILADVAAVHVVAKRGVKLLGDRTFQLNRQIRETACRIELAGLDERSGRACLEASRARTALVDAGRVGIERKCADDFREEQPRADLRVDQAGVLPYPPEAGVLRIDPLLDRAGIDIRAC